MGASFSSPVQTGPGAPLSLLHNVYRVFPGGKERPARDAEASPLLVPWSRKSRAITLLPLWAVRPVQILSACTKVHFTFTLHVSNPRVLLQEDSCIYIYGLVCSVCISISSLYRTHTCTYETPYPDACKTSCTIPVRTTFSLKMNP